MCMLYREIKFLYKIFHENYVTVQKSFHQILGCENIFFLLHIILEKLGRLALYVSFNYQLNIN